MAQFTLKVLFAFILLGVISLVFEFVVLSTSWFESSLLVVFNAIYALRTIPLIDTLIDILIAVALFEFFYFTAKYALRFLQWLDFTGASFLEN